jgi:hypothetical protein
MKGSLSFIYSWFFRLAFIENFKDLPGAGLQPMVQNGNILPDERDN